MTKYMPIVLHDPIYSNLIISAIMPMLLAMGRRFHFLLKSYYYEIGLL